VDRDVVVTAPSFDTPTGRWLGLFGLPAITANALGIYRALLGGSLLLIVLAYPIDAVPLEAQRVYSPLAGAGWVRTLAANGAATSAVHVLALTSALAFAAGIRARVAYAVLVAALSLRTLFILLQAGAHDWGTPLLTLWALLVVPWDDAPSPLAPLRRDGRGPGVVPASPDLVRQRSWRYGFAVWLPGFTIGLAFAAAALEKLRRSGLDWITTGAVRYHFVEDAANAPFDLGMWVATQPQLAVALSLGGILIEAFFIAVIFVGDWRARAAFGVAAAALMAGFWVFQGVHWWPWLMFLAAFLPWNRGPAAHASGATARLLPVHASVVILLVAGQVWASYRRIEIEPLFSHYPMYSTTYESPEHYENAHAEMRFQVDGQDITPQVRGANGSGALARAVAIPRAERASRPDIQQPLEEFRQRYQDMYGAAPSVLDIFERRRPFDWDEGQFKPEVLQPIGRVELVD
jgi:hypothetical protein